MYKIIIVFVLLFMSDPCNSPGKKVSFNDFCKVENFDEFVEVSGFLTDNGKITCDKVDGTYPSCMMHLRENADSKELIMVSIDQDRGSSGMKGMETGRRFDELEIFDRSGNKIDHANKPVTLSGVVQIDPLTSGCIMRVRRVEQQ